MVYLQNPVTSVNQQLAKRPQSIDPSTAQVRKALSPYSGKGVGVAVIEVASEPDHARWVTSKISDPEVGVAPKAKIYSYQLNFPAEHVVNPEKIPDLKSFLVNHAKVGFDILIKKLQEVSREIKAGKDIRVINLSNGISPGEVAAAALEQMQNLRIAKWQGTFRKEIEGKNGSQESLIKNYVSRTILEDAGFQRSLKQYQDVVEKLSKQKVVIVTAATNLGPHLGTDGGNFVNFSSMSPKVITVGGVNSNRTPTLSRDDTVWEFSARGNGTWNPTVLAPSTDIVVRDRVSRKLINKTGNSYAAPVVSGIIAALIEANNNLSPDQIRVILKQTSHSLGRPATEQGAGAIDPAKALSRVKSGNKG